MYSHSKWYALYTRSRSEKSVHSLLIKKGIESFLPIRKELKQYSDRKKWVEEPLICSYLFVNVDNKNYYEALKAPGSVRFVFFEGRPAPLPDKQIHYLQQIVHHSPLDIQVSSEQLIRGEMVEICRGPLKGHQGRASGNQRQLPVVASSENSGHRCAYGNGFWRCDANPGGHIIGKFYISNF